MGCRGMIFKPSGYTEMPSGVGQQLPLMHKMGSTQGREVYHHRRYIGAHQLLARHNQGKGLAQQEGGAVEAGLVPDPWG